jgi:PAS domain S-box-containing protein
MAELQPDGVKSRVQDADGVDLVQAHNALAESEARLRLIIDAAGEAIVTCDESGMVLTWNREAQRMFGRSEEQAIGEELAALIAAPREQEQCRELVRAVHTNAPPVRVEMTGARDDGSEFPMELSVIAVEWGVRVLRTAFIRDITDRVRAEHESKQVAAIVNASADAIFAVTTDGTITSWNPAAERIFAHRADSMRAAPLARLFPKAAADTVRWLLDSIALGIPIEASPVECTRNESETFQAFVSVSPIRADGAVSGAAVVVRDASEQLQSRDRVKDAEILATLGRLATSVGHQFNNVLMGIQPFVDILRRSELPPQAARAVEQIAKSVQRGRRATAEIQSFTRASEAPVIRSVTVTKWLDTLRDDLELALGAGIELTIEIEDGQLTLAADSAKLRQVFVNLATNARDAMPRGGRCTIAVRAAAVPPPHATRADDDCGWAEILVSDSGAGIDEESRRRIFEPLFTKNRGGSGLELATVQQIVRSHGGIIEVTSEPGCGTAFRMLLPRSKTTEPEGPAAVPATSGATPRRVLLVEDDTSVAAGLSLALSTHGMHVDVVHTGGRVMRAVEAFLPEIVVLDVQLPDVNGFDVYRQLAAVHPDLPVIFSTGHADEFDREAAEPLRLAHVELLRKPYATETLLAAMERVTSRKG